MNITRRRILVLSLSFLGLANSRLSMSALLNAYSEDWINVLATGLDQNAVKQVASVYLKQYPEEKYDPDRMISLILNGYDNKEDRGGFLRRTVRMDFTNNDIVNLSGWRLSRTEGRILTLLSAMLSSNA